MNRQVQNSGRSHSNINVRVRTAQRQGGIMVNQEGKRNVHRAAVEPKPVPVKAAAGAPRGGENAYALKEEQTRKNKTVQCNGGNKEEEEKCLW